MKLLIFLIEADVNAKTAKHRLKIKIKECLGYDLDDIYLILNVLAYRSPKIVFSGLQIIDVGNDVMAKHQNGQLEKGELVKIKGYIQNIGQGISKHTQYSIYTTDSNIFLKDTFGHLGTLNSGDVKDFTFFLSPNNRFISDGNLPVFLTIKESVGFGNLKNFQLPIKVNKKPKKIEIVKVKPKMDAIQAQIAKFEFASNKFTMRKDKLIDVNNITYSKTKLKNSIAVVIGVEKYKKVYDAPYAVNDAILIKQYFEKRLGIEKVVVFTDNEVSGFFFDDIFNPEYGELQKEIIKGKTELFIYYSGHGIPDKNGTKTYLFPSDGKISRLDSQGYSLLKFYKNLKMSGAKHVTVIIDACFSGASRQTEKMKAKNIVSMKGIKLNIKKPWLLYDNFTVINSSSNEETSLGYEETKTGLFTYFFSAGLLGEADLNRDRLITFKELKTYVIENVSKTSKRIGGIQTPEFFGNNDDIILKY